MDNLKIYTQQTIQSFLATRHGETKFGECVQTIAQQNSLKNALTNSTAKYVLLGVNEDLGVQLNRGIGGAHQAWEVALKALLNIQENQFNKGAEVLVLGCLDYTSQIKSLTTYQYNYSQNVEELMATIDNDLSSLIKLIVESGKKPIIIGGGHNNAYGNLKGTSMALKKPVNAVNFDAHTDFRNLEIRHSGNGFSYAFEEGYLHKYFMFGIHENYTPNTVLDTIQQKPEQLQFNTFEELEIHKTKRFKKELKRAMHFVNDQPFGLEIDLDTVQNFPSSAMTPSGFSATKARRFVSTIGKDSNVAYLHICEGAPTIVNHNNSAAQVGKFIAYLISDFIKANNP